MNNINLKFLSNDLEAQERLSSLGQIISSLEPSDKNNLEPNIASYLNAVNGFSPSSSLEALNLAEKINKFLFKIKYKKEPPYIGGHHSQTVYEFIRASIERRLIFSYVKSENVFILELLNKLGKFSFKNKDDYTPSPECVFLNACYNEKKPHLITQGYLNQLLSFDNYNQWLLCVNSKEIFNETLKTNSIALNSNKIKEWLFNYLPVMDFDFILHVCKKNNIDFVQYTLELQTEKPQEHSSLIKSLIEENQIKTLKYLYKNKVFSFIEKPQTYLDHCLAGLIIKNSIKQESSSNIQEMISFLSEQIVVSGKKFNKNYEIKSAGIHQKASPTIENAHLFFILAFVRTMQSKRLHTSLEGQYVNQCVDILIEKKIPYFSCAKILEYIFEQENPKDSKAILQTFASRYEKKALEEKLALVEGSLEIKRLGDNPQQVKNKI